ncbi:hypothetical protein ACWC2T_33645 [Streptomyces sp. NPDC001393]
MSGARFLRGRPDMRALTATDLAALALPDLIPAAPPPDDWSTPASLRPVTGEEKR